MAERRRRKPAPVKIAGESISAGTRKRLDLPVARISTGQVVDIPLVVVHGARKGPSLWISAAVHGDEIEGVEIIHQLLPYLDPAKMAGTIYAMPVVNVFGFINQSRYLPDRRDLNRSFPGRPEGSLASRMAHFFMEEIVSRCEFGIDLHCGSNDRTNIPQVRANLDDPETRRCAEAFGAPVMIHSKGPKGTLRRAATQQGVRVVLFEGGEPRRFSPAVTEAGVRGTLRMLSALGMRRGRGGRPEPSIESSRTSWVRASRGGVFHLDIRAGIRVRKGQRLGVISDPTGIDADDEVVKATTSGIVIGHALNPLVSWGDALVHIAIVRSGRSGSAT